MYVCVYRAKNINARAILRRRAVARDRRRGEKRRLGKFPNDDNVVSARLLFQKRRTRRRRRRRDRRKLSLTCSRAHQLAALTSLLPRYKIRMSRCLQRKWWPISSLRNTLPPRKTPLVRFLGVVVVVVAPQFIEISPRGGENLRIVPIGTAAELFRRALALPLLFRDDMKKSVERRRKRHRETGTTADAR